MGGPKSGGSRDERNHADYYGQNSQAWPEAIDFDEALKSAKENELSLFFQAGYPPLGHSMSKFEKIGVFVGPEGGWTEEEIKKAQSSNGFTIVGLGKTVLRAETAVVIASYQTINLC